MERNLSSETLCVHAGTRLSDRQSGVNTPIYASSSFHYRESSENVYPRYYNTINQKALVEKLCALEHGENGLLTSSGMAAISTTLFTFLQSGDHAIFSTEIYGGTFNLIVTEFKKQGIEFTFIEENTPLAYSTAIRSNTKVIYIETPSNPLLSVVDIEAVAKLAKEAGIISIIDNTFATPINQMPISLGVDVVVHSGTKFLGGHSDLCFGAIITSHVLKEKILKTAYNYGGSLNALDCYLIERSLKTLALRVVRQSDNALAIARFLSECPSIEKVFYPGLETHPGNEIAKKQMKYFGGMLAFQTKDADLNRINQALDKLRLIQPALSLGGVDTIICSPAQTSHLKMPENERKKIGITEGTLRVSTGIENSEDLIADLRQAFDL